jgi:DNA-binding LacI/PurR family transcriptional regulator
LQGYQAALQAYGLPSDPVLVAKGGFRLEDGRQAFHHLLSLETPPSALFAYNDMMAIGALRGAYEMGLRVPEDFSIVGFDDISQAAFTCPALTTIKVDKFEMGRRGAALLLNLIDKETPDPDLMKPLDVSLVVRESTGPIRRT